MIHASPILVIAGSVRARRLCILISQWVADIGAEFAGGRPEVIDLREWILPPDDEPGVPAAGHYVQGHTLAWSRKIAAARGVVFVTPQYNWGYPAPLKNALDHLYKEWAGKPAMIVTYGGHRGSKCSRQLLQVCKALHMRPVSPRPQMLLPRSLIEDNSGEVDPAVLFKSNTVQIRSAFKKLAALAGV